MKTKSHNKNKYNVITLGCSKNVVDSEVLVAQLKHNDFEVEHQSEKKDANIIIINTCGFIDRAKEESINTILSYAEQKNKGRIDKLYVTGCLSQRYKDDLETEIPQVDAFFGTLELPQLLDKLNADYKHELVGERTLSTPQHFAYLKISEGCNRTCTFCAIPIMRGKHISKSIEEIISEANHLAKQGVKEIMLIAQELTYYGLDIYKERSLSKLLYALNDVNGIEWIRLHYAYPSKFPLDIIDAIRDCNKVCNYLDLPLQHANNRILKRMQRQITQEETRQLIHEIRAKLPDIAIRTTMLVGFPGETESDFNDLCNFVQEMQFERLGVFQYSHEDDTAAFELEDDVDADTKEERASRLMQIQQEISFQKNELKIGKEFKVLIDRKEGQYFVGRTEYDSPEVDNEVLIDAKKYFCRMGDFCKVKITDATDFDLYGEVVQ
ncbi:MAG TPA: 30S ribosomal protein S12 methylthiotransferase RimO [Chitinophagales bacterium]|jgi:ribosomal protein S12 methylthiotransferase|nr:30S ribosomal protein S12 methylthiotransferase RimO [Chitinophagales bacterium]HQV77340.1 30S ribosomal protein S12 methylthiotransferase RimO [Chitinophagales bacterium]HQW78402.1 30S ribosomal protein S12 methylthiotransferase RimO [Chitinophagales bacterium]HRB18720.1 30S ribosomal protein S12 methylthiotransferase RimO [Chitinophagales bacterium]HRB66844.1 30S ribosomal protein S12 methylthiotransferase RimO [Chitinophagales bacterium]